MERRETESIFIIILIWRRIKIIKHRTSIDADDTYGMEFTLFNVVNDSNQPLGYYYARILYVLPNSPASSAGLERGDWIVGVKGKIILIPIIMESY